MRCVYGVPCARDDEAGRIREPAGQVVLGSQKATVLTTYNHEDGHLNFPKPVHHGCVAMYAKLPGGWVGIRTDIHGECESIPLIASCLVAKAGTGGDQHQCLDELGILNRST